MTDVSAMLGLIVAVLGGACVGRERQWSGHASGRNAHFGGIRTFTLLGGVPWTKARGPQGRTLDFKDSGRWSNKAPY